MATDDDVNDHAVDYSEDAENSDNRLSHHTVIHIDTHIRTQEPSNIQAFAELASSGRLRIHDDDDM